MEEINCDDIPEFENFLNFSELIPHHLKFKMCEDDKKYFINSTLNCLTNTKSFLEYIYSYNDIFNNISEYFVILYRTIKDIVYYLREIKEKEKKI